MNYIDPDGKDDYFDKYGNFQYRDNKETDYIMVQLDNGEYQNLIEFDYSDDQIDNRKMLSNIATYYMNEAGIDGECRVKTLSQKEYEKYGEGFASVNPKTLLASIRVFDGRVSANANTASNLINAFVHEDVHVGGDNNEIHAILQQMRHRSWGTATSTFKFGIIGYAITKLNDPEFLLEWTREFYYVPLPLSQYIWYDDKCNIFGPCIEVFISPKK